MTTYQIQDWTGKICFGGKTFESFEEGWDHIYQNDPEHEEGSLEWIDGWYDDYYVEVVAEEYGVEFEDS